MQSALGLPVADICRLAPSSVERLTSGNINGLWPMYGPLPSDFWSLLVSFGHTCSWEGGLIGGNQFEAGFVKYSYFSLSPSILKTKTKNPQFWYLAGLLVLTKTNHKLFTFHLLVLVPLQRFPGLRRQFWTRLLPSTQHLFFSISTLNSLFISNIFLLKILYSFHPLPKRFPNEEGHWMQFGKKWIFYNPFNIPPSEAFWQARPNGLAHSQKA